MKIYLAWLRACMLSRVWFFVTLWTVVHQAPRSMGFSRQEYWRKLPFPPPGDLPNPGIEPCILRLLRWGVNYLTWATWEARLTTSTLNKPARHLEYKAESWDWCCSAMCHARDWPEWRVFGKDYWKRKKDTTGGQELCLGTG